MVDGTVVETEGRVQFVLKCGGYRGQISARVFPNMNKPMILGIPWFSKENPHIDWTEATVVVNKDHRWISLPLAKPSQSNPVHLANKISASQANQMLKSKEVERAFLGIIRLVEEESQGMDVPEESMTMQKPKWDQALLSSIRAVLEEFDVVFPQDLPLGLPPVREGTSSKLILRMRCPQSIAYYTRSARSSWKRPRNKLRACSSTASSDHRILPTVPQSCLYPRRMGAFGFALTTVG